MTEPTHPGEESPRTGRPVTVAAAGADEEPERWPVDADRLVRWSTIVVVVLVALAAAYVSYRHAYELIHDHGESGTAARIGPATVDGLIYASGMVLLQAARYRQAAPPLAYFGLWLGIAATVGANVAHGWSHGVLGALVSAWPAVALIVSYELLMKIIRVGAARGAEPGPDERAATGDACPHGVAATVQEAVVNAWLHARDCLGEELSQRQLATDFDVKDRKKIKTWLDAAAPKTAPVVLEPPAAPSAQEEAPALNGGPPA